MVSSEQHRVIAFDVDGVIIRGFWLSQIFARLGLVKSFVFGVLGILYEARIMEVASFLRYAYRLLRGAPYDWLLRMTDQASLTRGVQKTFEILRNQGHIIVLLSSGIPDFAVSRLAEKVGAHFAFGIRVEVEDDLLTGYIAALDCIGQSKVEALQDLVATHNLSDHEIVAVANDRNNIPLLNYATLAVGYRPDRVIRRIVRSIVTTPDFRALLPILSAPSVSVYIPRRLSQEVIRQLLHASAVLVPFLWLSDVSWHLPIFVVIGGLSFLFLFSEFLRSHGIRIPLIAKLVQAAGRENEIGRYALSPIFFATGVAVPLLLFGTIFSFPYVAAASVSAFLIGDSFSTIGGRLFGRHHYPFNKKKTLEGTIIGFSLAFLVLLLMVSLISALLCATLAALVELIPSPIDDNLAVPIITATILVLLQLLGIFTFI